MRVLPCNLQWTVQVVQLDFVQHFLEHCLVQQKSG